MKRWPLSQAHQLRTTSPSTIDSACETTSSSESRTIDVPCKNNGRNRQKSERRYCMRSCFILACSCRFERREFRVFCCGNYVAPNPLLLSSVNGNNILFIHKAKKR